MSHPVRNKLTDKEDDQLTGVRERDSYQIIAIYLFNAHIVSEAVCFSLSAECPPLEILKLMMSFGPKV